MSAKPENISTEWHKANSDQLTKFYFDMESARCNLSVLPDECRNKLFNKCNF